MKVRQPHRKAVSVEAEGTEARVSRSGMKMEGMKNPAKQSVSWHDPILLELRFTDTGAVEEKDWLRTALGRPPEPGMADGRCGAEEESCRGHGRKDKG